ncbi:F-box protein CPR1-like [Papaver somniferum]|uniref:F-box protein CPR1-like n=1 Tax=Papaver somniferum TaxID=3469 RepID=UPI000E7013BE|nr:F-box protein CPR1-like [Papaver somniferum]
MRSNSWSSVHGTVKYSISSRLRSNGVFFSGALHWFGRIAAQETSSEVIDSFDISNELMIDMPLPENITVRPSDFQWDLYLGVWGDCICIALVWQLAKVDVWVMKEYGVRSVLAGKTGDNLESYVESIVSLGSGTYVEELMTDGIVTNPQRPWLSYFLALTFALAVALCGQCDSYSKLRTNVYV